jgi:tRNA threonylcarbamoyladenosine biosynthesis protein TsaE
MAAEPTELVFRLRSPAPEITEAFGERLGRALVPGALVALDGELGSGKTTLVRGLARGLDVREPVVSPTFTRMRVLPGRLVLHHFDAWRAGSAELFEEGTEFLAGDGVAAVEWAERVATSLPCPRLELRLELCLDPAGEAARLIEARLVPPVAPGGPATMRLAAGLRTALAAARATPGLVLAP